MFLTWSFFETALVVFILWRLVGGRKNYFIDNTPLVLTQFDVNQNNNPDEPCVNIKGRSSGIIPFLLGLMEIESTTTVKVYDNRIEFWRDSRLYGTTSTTIPLVAISGIHGGYSKPFTLLILAGISLMIGLYVAYIPSYTAPADNSFFWTSVIISFILVVLYFLRKTMGIRVQNGGDELWGVNFKRSVIENVSVDIDRVKLAVTVVNQKVLQIRSKAGSVD
ncbi:MAG: hypothetical protein DRR19_07345 [Candidatus Parabeggiatoa sp. nov. 1]|nr:MAG: hypothetical protein DRR19_07345 [Gammaproteobacteria bacterium]